MNAWYFAREGQQKGPVATEELRRLLESEELPAETLVWQEGMDEWQPASETLEWTPSSPAPELGSAEELSPYAPPKAAPDESPIPMAVPTSGNQVRPWIRYWARTIDIFLFALVMGFSLGFLLPAVLEINDMLFNVLLLAGMTFYEAACLALFSATPGKAMLRVRVTRPDGSRLSYGAALGRAFQVFIRGLGLGIPLVAFVTQIVGYQNLSRDGTTTWDRDGNHLVSHQSIPVWRGLLVAVGVLAAFGGVGYLISLAGEL